MAKASPIYIWKKAPFLRLLLPLMAGIIVEFYFKIPVSYLLYFVIILLAALILFRVLPEADRYQFRVVQGILISILIIICGSLITWQKDIRNQTNWYGKNLCDSSFFIATINEPLVDKAKSYKALANVEFVVCKEVRQKVRGNILIYFAKDSVSQKLKYGDRIIVRNKLQSIKNSGNPGAFDYAQYSAFQQVFHQAYLRQNEWLLLKSNHANFSGSIIYKTRDYVLETLDEYIHGNDESALAKALLIGYRIDIGKDLVQAYTNVGVVHLIAISGLHLALIYYLLVWLFAKIPIIKNSKFTKLALVLFCLWFFSLLTGAPASVLRASVMFSFIAIGASFDKKNSIYNSLSISAFVLLCFDPFMLWDVGFQLSYLAVLGIVIAQKHVYNWFYFKNKILDEGWKLASVSLAAQLFTMPVCLYYFHQFPLLFLISNMAAIPLSTIALWGCIALIAVSPIPLAAVFLGKLTGISIWLLNHSVLVVNAIPFSLWDEISISVTATIILYIVIISMVYWLIKKSKIAFKITLASILLFVIIIAEIKWQSYHQRKIIVYNIAQHSAIDFVNGTQYSFVGDSAAIKNNLIKNYNIRPARISLQLDSRLNSPGIIYSENNFYQFHNKKLLIADSFLIYHPLAEKIKLDYIVISKNPQITITGLSQTFDCKSYIFDASNSQWKIEKWKKECEELHLHFHSVSEQGAFVTDL
jgi:competence protein ComEC